MITSTAPPDVITGTGEGDDTTESSSVLDNLPALTGFIWARLWQVYHVANLSDAALREAQDLLGALSNLAAKSAHARPGKQKTDALNMAEVSAVLGEVLDCIDLAAEQLSALNTDIRLRLADQES